MTAIASFSRLEHLVPFWDSQLFPSFSLGRRRAVRSLASSLHTQLVSTEVRFITAQMHSFYGLKLTTTCFFHHETGTPILTQEKKDKEMNAAMFCKAVFFGRMQDFPATRKTEKKKQFVRGTHVYSYMY